MARGPAGDEKILLAEPISVPYSDRIYLLDLVRYLRAKNSIVTRWLRERGLLHHTYRDPGRVKVRWVTPRTAERLILFVRMRQGQVALEGKRRSRLPRRRRKR